MARITPTFESRAFGEHADRIHADLRRAQVRALNATGKRVVEGLRLSMEEHPLQTFPVLSSTE